MRPGATLETSLGRLLATLLRRRGIPSPRWPGWGTSSKPRSVWSRAWKVNSSGQPRRDAVVSSSEPPKLNDEQQALVDQFHTFMYDITDENSHWSYFVSWLGYGMFKWPTDLWNYQEIVVQTKPDVIVETGTHRRGSALFLASICRADPQGRGHFRSTPTIRTGRRSRNILGSTFLSGSSTDPNIIAEVKVPDRCRRTNVFVILDSDHPPVNDILDDLWIYRANWSRSTAHLVVEDTNVNGHPAYPEFRPGPRARPDRFVPEGKLVL